MEYFYPLVGDLMNEGAFIMYDERWKQYGTMSPETASDTLSHHETQKLHRAAHLSNQQRGRMKSLLRNNGNKLHIFLDTNGGYDSAQHSAIGLAQDMSDKGEVYLYGGNKVMSAGANIFGANINNAKRHCLRNTSFLWHGRQIVENSTIEQPDHAHILRLMRYYTRQLFSLLLAARKINLVQRAGAQLFSDDHAFNMELQEMFDQSPLDYLASGDLSRFNMDGDFTATGMELQGIKGLTIHEDFDSLRKSFVKNSHMPAIRKGKEITSRMFNMSEVVWRLREEGVDCRVIHDSDDDLSVELDGPFQSRVTALIAELI